MPFRGSIPARVKTRHRPVHADLAAEEEEYNCPRGIHVDITAVKAGGGLSCIQSRDTVLQVIARCVYVVWTMQHREKPRKGRELFFLRPKPCCSSMNLCLWEPEDGLGSNPAKYKITTERSCHRNPWARKILWCNKYARILSLSLCLSLSPPTKRFKPIYQYPRGEGGGAVPLTSANV